MIKCKFCSQMTDYNKPICENCGLLLNVDLNDQKSSFFTKILYKKIISDAEWLKFFLILLIPLFNIYIVFKYGYFIKNESNITNFCKALVKFVIFMLVCVVLIRVQNEIFNFF
ncbi:hypothetical protein EW093_02270 [Thiospirochaeta perfilievii]|uniref:Uncharacterized protein n=1 Tax=Thiospirochaeta perfilievii TaxID=252967 RepID=A0A5C1Q937_9SPIO|nr:hypothetical protein [Thiospirochaeta perfilievii]QEN03570.1 hypothetical protein EW093_02270 [Thiospirochaeta perfilievii]